MGRVVTQVRIANPMDPGHEISFDALVDTGAARLVLPTARRERQGRLGSSGVVEVELADQSIASGEVVGPVEVQLEAFPPIHSEVLFLDLEPQDGRYQPLVGYIILEQTNVAVDVIGHLLVPLRYVDLK